MATSPSNASSDHREVAEAALEFLISEAVDWVHRAIAQRQAAAAKALGDAPVQVQVPSPPATPASGSPPSGEKDREGAYYMLENMGYRVGVSIVERITWDRPRFADNLEVVKFICKDFWVAIFKKQIDNLKTNHRGVYVLTDNSFRWFLRMSTEGGAAETSRRAFPYLAFPCGLIRGALANLGVASVVIAEVTNIPQCTFQIKITKS
ncbi:NO signaling/Golgi transport ligand-binding domain-containing protein [Cladochytrium replicatum]|nr:NO signaling/Golgi transport ligand-binding domain-containing protein [Cladochytrium replicatum]